MWVAPAVSTEEVEVTMEAGEAEGATLIAFQTCVSVHTYGHPAHTTGAHNTSQFIWQNWFQGSLFNQIPQFHLWIKIVPLATQFKHSIKNSSILWNISAILHPPPTQPTALPHTPPSFIVRQIEVCTRRVAGGKQRIHLLHSILCLRGQPEPSKNPGNNVSDIRSFCWLAVTWLIELFSVQIGGPVKPLSVTAISYDWWLHGQSEPALFK